MLTIKVLNEGCETVMGGFTQVDWADEILTGYRSGETVKLHASLGHRAAYVMNENGATVSHYRFTVPPKAA